MPDEPGNLYVELFETVYFFFLSKGRKWELGICSYYLNYSEQVLLLFFFFLGKKSSTSTPIPLITGISIPIELWLLLEWILQNMVREFVTHEQVQADKRLPI